MNIKRYSFILIFLTLSILLFECNIALNINHCSNICAVCSNCTNNDCTNSSYLIKCNCDRETDKRKITSTHNICTFCNKCIDKEFIDESYILKCNCRNANYAPHTVYEIPKIDINTPNNNNNWTTKYIQKDKLNGLIDYVEPMFLFQIVIINGHLWINKEVWK